MDRLYYIDSSKCPVEETVVTCKGITLYDGDNKSPFIGEVANLTPNTIIFSSPSRPTVKLILEMKCVVLIEEEIGGLMRSNKLVLHLSPFENAQYSKPVARSTASHIKLGFTEGGFTTLKNGISKVLADRAWDRKLSQLPNAPTEVKSVRSGIVGIERRIQEKNENTATNINMAFQDLKNLMGMAKDMVRLANVMSIKMKERQGDVSDDETVKFKSYLLSLGIADPVTRDAFSSGDAYITGLAKQIAQFLLEPITKMGGLMGLTDAYCRMNRARGFELLSPEDFLQACRRLNGHQTPIKLRRFDSGVYILQLNSQVDTQIDGETARMLEEKKKLTAFEMSRELGLSVLLAVERLLSAEKAGMACRDDSIMGLVFYPNRFLKNT